jgi:hypothetical protein
MRIATSSNRPVTPETIEKIETFVSEIQLYGTPTQVAQLSLVVEEFKKPVFNVQWDFLLADLRDTIRSELRLEPIQGGVWWLRLTMPRPPGPLSRAAAADTC